ncbi:MAG: GDP-mannose 4,6-dehydratase, partial [Thermodesulfobium sp.]
NADVRYNETSGTNLDLKVSTIGTYNILEAMRLNDVKYILFSSSSSVYGNARIIPTPEKYGPLFPESLYAASKLGSESLISAFSFMFGFRSLLYRFANITAPLYRSVGRNVIPDFIFKLKKNQNELEVLGNGDQEKSYLYVEDCIHGMLFLAKKMSEKVDVFNLGNKDSTNVRKIAEIVIQEMGLNNVNIKFTGGQIGWKGDISKTILDITKSVNRGWEIKYNSEEAVRISARKILKKL